MKAVILAGGFGTRISEETGSRPKPMIEVGRVPLIHHLLSIFAKYGVNEFIICCGYKGYLIKDYFVNYLVHSADIRVSLASNRVDVLNTQAPDWEVTLVDTGLDSMTGERLRRVRPYLQNDERFFMTYGDGLANVDLKALLATHNAEKRKATVTAVRPPGRFGALEVGSHNNVRKFVEKPLGDGGYINGGFFVLESSIFDYLEGLDNPTWENEPLSRLASDKQLTCFVHDGFWMAMDTLRDKIQLDELASRENLPWL